MNGDGPTIWLAAGLRTPFARVDGRRSHDVVVIQYKQCAAGQCRQVVEQAGEHDLRRRPRRRVEQGQRRTAALGSDGLEGSD